MGDAMDDEAMRWTMRRCHGRWAEAMRRCYHRPIASPHSPSHRLIVHRVASSSIASPHRPLHRPIASPYRASHRFIVHRVPSSSTALDIIRNASVSLLGHHNIVSYYCAVHQCYRNTFTNTTKVILPWSYTCTIEPLLIQPPSYCNWCGRIRGMVVARD